MWLWILISLPSLRGLFLLLFIGGVGGGVCVCVYETWLDYFSKVCFLSLCGISLWRALLLACTQSLWMGPEASTINHIVRLSRVLQGLWVNKDTLIRAFQKLRDHLQGAQDKGQTSLWARSILYYPMREDSTLVGVQGILDSGRRLVAG